MRPLSVLVTGAGGQLGSELVAALEAGPVSRRSPGGGGRSPGGGPSTQAVEVVAARREQLDVADRDAVLQAFGALSPDLVIHAGAWTAVDDCEGDPERAYRVNALGTRHVAEGAAGCGAHLCYISTDYVFDGRATRPYREWDDADPLSVYGRSKLGGERECPPGTTIVRSAWICGTRGPNMATTILALGRRPGPLRFVDDQRGSPTVASELARAIRGLVIERRPGIFHLTNQGDASWYQVARAVLAGAGLDPARVEPVASGDLRPPRPAPRPAYSVLDNAAMRLSGLPLLDDWHEAFARLAKELA